MYTKEELLIKCNKTYCADFKEAIKKIPDNSIDLIYTDPPYPKEYLHTFKLLADEASRIMKDNSHMFVLSGNLYFPEIFTYFQSSSLKYIEIHCLNISKGPCAKIFKYNIDVAWKPILHYFKGDKYTDQIYTRNMIVSPGPSKAYHKWEQNPAWCTSFIEKFSKPGDIVLDPYMGSGTVGVACRMLNRNFIGFDIDQKAVDTANARTAEPVGLEGWL